MPGRGNPRKTDLEQCYTPASAASYLTRLVVDNVPIPVGATWIEPAAGTGAFVDAATACGAASVLAYDIDPKRSDVLQQDFLTVNLNVSHAVCITNPPFGRNHSLSIPFFNKLAGHCDVMGFIVPRSWRKWTIVNRLDRSFHKVADYDLDLSYVDVHGDLLTKSRLLNTVFQVWVRQDDPRPLFPVKAPESHFNIVKPEKATASLTIFGRGCATVKTVFPPKANSTQMFIDADKEVLESLRVADLSPFFTQVAFVEALSRTEIDYAITARQAGECIPPDFLTTSGLIQSPNQVASLTGLLDLRNLS